MTKPGATMPEMPEHKWCAFLLGSKSPPGWLTVPMKIAAETVTGGLSEMQVKGHKNDRNK